MAAFQLSFEFFPPKTPQGVDKLSHTLLQLAPFRPEFASVTFGAGGGTQRGTLEMVQVILEHRAKYPGVFNETFTAVPHLSCVGVTREEVRAMLASYRQQGIRHIVALRGDLPSGMGRGGELRHAYELVDIIRAEHGEWFQIYVAAYPEFHPEALSPSHDIAAFVQKVHAGANAAITQYFYNADAYFRFVDAVQRFGVKVPIFAGIMPITNHAQLMRFSALCGAEVPRWIARRLEEFGENQQALRDFGIEVVARLCEQLIAQGAPGLHFYTLNGAQATLAICEQLNLKAQDVQTARANGIGA